MVVDEFGLAKFVVRAVFTGVTGSLKDFSGRVDGSLNIFERKFPTFASNVPVKFVVVIDFFERIAVGVGEMIGFGAGESLVRITNADDKVVVFSFGGVGVWVVLIVSDRD